MGSCDGPYVLGRDPISNILAAGAPLRIPRPWEGVALVSERAPDRYSGDHASKKIAPLLSTTTFLYCDLDNRISAVKHKP